MRAGRHKVDEVSIVLLFRPRRKLAGVLVSRRLETPGVEAVAVVGIGWVEWADQSRDGFPPRAWKLADTDAALADTADHRNRSSLLIGQGFLDDLLHLRGLHH